MKLAAKLAILIITIVIISSITISCMTFRLNATILADVLGGKLGPEEFTIKLRDQLIAVSSVVIAFSILIALFFSRALSAPVTRLNQLIKDSREDLAASERKLRVAYKTMHIGMLFIDAETGQILGANQYLLDLFNYPLSELLKKKFWEIGIPQELIVVSNPGDEPGPSGYVRRGEVSLETRDGRQIMVEFAYGAYIEKGRKKIQCSVRDITVRNWMESRIKKLNEQLQQKASELEATNRSLKRVDELKSDFISTVSHELRTPLGIIQEGISQVNEGMHGELAAGQKHMLTVSFNNVIRLGHIINDLLDISKIEAGKFELKKERFDFVKLAQEISSDFDYLANNKAVEIRKVFQKQRIDVFADRGKIAQVLINLLNNAVKFTEKGHIELSISTDDQGALVECSVSDTGPGIAKEDLPKVFGKFQQFGRTFGPGEKGTGLGLSICKGIIGLHNGNIQVESEVGKGSKFSFTLPLYSVERLFREYIAGGVRDAASSQRAFSVMIFEVKNFDALEKDIGHEKAVSITQNLEALIKTNLIRRADAAIKDTGAILVLLPATEKKDALVIAERLRLALDKYLRGEGSKAPVELLFKYAAFPEDADNEDELFRKIMSDSQMCETGVEKGE